MSNTETNIWNSPVMKNKEILNTWKKLSTYVAKVCINRDESHGHIHMEKVAINTIKIILGESTCRDACSYCVFQVYNAMIIAWLHDVCDHKYDQKGELKKNMIEFISKDLMVSDSLGKIITCAIDSVSFSKENKKRLSGMSVKDIYDEWVNSMGYNGLVWRNFVSDADKLEAIGKEGIYRCMQYTIERYYKKNGTDMPKEELIADVKQHAKDKLLRLKDEFIVTKTGKQMAEVLHNEMVVELEKL